MKKALLLSATAIIAAAVQPAHAYDEQEGGYVYQYTSSSEDRFLDNVYNFLFCFDLDYIGRKYKDTTMDQYYWAESPCFDTYNNFFLDGVDFAYYSGHGNNWLITMGPGADYSPDYVYLHGSKFNGRHKGWGDNSLEFVTFQSCAVLPSPIERSDWYSNWVAEPYDLFDGLHQAIGYRVNSYSGNGISADYGDRIANNDEAVWQAWFNAVNTERDGYYPGYASAVMHPDNDGESYGCQFGDPDPSHTALKIWYQLGE